MNFKLSKSKVLSDFEEDLAFNIKAFLKDRKAQNLSPSTIYFYEKKIQEFLEFCLASGINKVPQITPELIREYLLALKDMNHNDGGIHAFYRVIKTFLLFWEEEYEPENWKNPVRKVKPPKVKVEPLQGISIELVHKFLSICERKTFFGERDRAILLVLIETGVRASELCSLNFGDVDFSDGSILVRQGKGRKPRNVFMGRSARKQLRVWIRYRGTEEGALFLNRYGERLSYMTLRQIIRRLAEKVGVPEPGLHDFRRTFALESLKKGVDIQSISRMMGHADLQILSRYLKQTKEDLANAYRSIIDG